MGYHYTAKTILKTQVRHQNSASRNISSWVLFGDSVDDLAILDEGCSSTNLYIHFGLVNPPLLESGYLSLPNWVREHVANILGISRPVDDGGVVRSHIPASSASASQIAQVSLKLFLEGGRGEVLKLHPV